MDALYTLALATIVLVAIPGPNVALIVANTLRHGLGFGVSTVLGTTLGIAVQLCVVVLGLTALLEVAAGIMVWLKWAGVAYLLYLGICTWRMAPADLSAVAANKQKAISFFGSFFGPFFGPLFWQGMGLAMINPKTLMFNAAFLPQFINAQSSFVELLLIAGVYLGVLFLGDIVWALSAQSARKLLKKFGPLRNKLTGGFLASAGVALALSKTHN